MYFSSQNLLLSFFIITTMIATNILAGKASPRDFSFHDNDNNNNRHGARAVTAKRETCHKDCQDDKEMCLNHVGVTNFSEKFVCLAQYGLCKKKCVSDEKLDGDEDESSSGSDSKRNFESNRRKTESNNDNNTGKKIVIDEKILRQLYRSMPKELLIDLLLLEQHSSSDGRLKLKKIM